jgi:hypothetical protein
MRERHTRFEERAHLIHHPRQFVLFARKCCELWWLPVSGGLHIG